MVREAGCRAFGAGGGHPHLSMNASLSALLSLTLLLVGCSSHESNDIVERDSKAVLPETLPRPHVDKVVRVIDGDTVELEKLGRVRLIGIDTPESVDPRRPIQVFAQEAASYTREHLLGEVVELEYDQTRTDRYGRALAYLRTEDGSLFNANIVRDGYAFAYVKYPFKYMEDFVRLQRQARENERGLWAENLGIEVPEYVLSTDEAVSDTPAELVSLTSPIHRGQTAQLLIHTLPQVLCRVQLIYASGLSQSGDLRPKNSGHDGIVMWEWRVGSRTQLGEWPLQVSCNGGPEEMGVLHVE